MQQEYQSRSSHAVKSAIVTQTVLAAGKQRGDTKQQHMLLKQLQGQKGIERTGELRRD